MKKPEHLLQGLYKAAHRAYECSVVRTAPKQCREKIHRNKTQN